MKKLFATSIPMILLLWSCTNNKLPSEGIEHITIFTNPTENLQNATLVKDTDLIADIITSINHSRSEPVKFRPDYKIEVKYKMDLKQVLVKERYANIEGKTFLLNEDLGAKLKSIVDRAALLHNSK